MSRYLLRDGTRIGTDVSIEGLDLFSYTDATGQVVHALASVEAERTLLRQMPSRLLPLFVRMEQALAKAVGRN